MPSFKHSGDLGDILYALPTVKALGGGILYLDVDGGKTEPEVIKQNPRGRNKFNANGYATIRPLLLQQPYLTDVQVWQGQAVAYNLDQARRLMSDQRLNLVALWLKAFNLNPAIFNQPWLTINDPPLRLHKPMLVNRTCRYHSKYHWWAANAPALAQQAIFLGFEKEHEIFEYTFDVKIEFFKARDALHIAQLLLGSQWLIGNQSFIMAIAHGLGTPYIEESYDYAPTSVFQRENGKYI